MFKDHNEYGDCELCFIALPCVAFVVWKIYEGIFG